VLLRLLVTLLRRLARRRGENPFQPERIRSLVVIEVTRLGDFLVVLPTLGALRRAFPDARLAIVADQRYAPFARTVVPEIDVLPLESPGSFWSFVRCMIALRSRQFDLALSMSPGRRNAILALASRAQQNVGYLTPRDSLTPYLLNAVPVEASGFRLPSSQVYGHENIEDRAWKVLWALGITENREPMRLDGKGSGRSGSSYVTIHPFSGWEYRTWDLDEYVELARRIVRSTDLEVVFVVPRAEYPQVTLLRSRIEGIPGVRMAEVETLEETARIVVGSRFYVGNDSGPLHLASMLGVPAVGLFGPAPPEITAPRSEMNAYLYRRVECSPCDQRTCLRPGDSCMHQIAVDDVTAAVHQLLRRFYPGLPVRNA
jgi:heptosyltransferase I